MKISDFTNNIKKLQQNEVKKTNQKTVADAQKTANGESESKPSSPAVSISLSSKAGLLNKAVDIANNSPDIRNEKVARIKTEVENGTYRINSDKIADKMLKDAASELLQ